MLYSLISDSLVGVWEEPCQADPQASSGILVSGMLSLSLLLQQFQIQGCVGISALIIENGFNKK
jgi:hypothetical protein